MRFVIRISAKTLARVAEHASHDPLLECCGLLAGREGVVTCFYPAENAAQNPATAYEIAPREIFDRMREMRAAGLDLLGIYHSHPNGKNEPSPRDIESAYYSDAAYFIISPLAGATRPIRAFSIRGGRAVELEIQVLSETESHGR